VGRQRHRKVEFGYSGIFPGNDVAASDESILLDITGQNAIEMGVLAGFVGIYNPRRM
jgi:energy-converting hydrogenase Eha subunit A